MCLGQGLTMKPSLAIMVVLDLVLIEITPSSL